MSQNLVPYWYLVSGIGGLTLQLSGLQISGVALSTILGIVLYLVLPEPKN